MIRVLVLLAVVAVVVVGDRAWRRRAHAIRTDDAPTPPVPVEWVAGADRNWLVFSTPWCASCGPVEERLRRADPGARVVRIDATEQPELAAALRIRSAPTVLLADGEGRVSTRLVGAGAVAAHVAAAAG